VYGLINIVHALELINEEDILSSTKKQKKKKMINKTIKMRTPRQVKQQRPRNRRLLAGAILQEHRGLLNFT
jgi:tRNA U54 and U55 pseudouridine synthase Pus10